MPTSYSTCPQCGAVYAAPETCQDRFNLAQSLELEQPELYAVHHLSVPCYMLQHNRYSAKGWQYARGLLVEFIHNGKSPQEIRKGSRKQVDSGHRTWSLTHGPKLAGVEEIDWSFTIADVRLDTPEHYCADVRAWTESILRDSEALDM